MYCKAQVRMDHDTSSANVISGRCKPLVPRNNLAPELRKGGLIPAGVKPRPEGERPEREDASVKLSRRLLGGKMRRKRNRAVSWIVTVILMAPWYMTGLESAFTQPSGGSQPVVISPLVREILLRGWFVSASGHVVNPRTNQVLEFRSGFGAGGGQWVDVKTGQAVSGWQISLSDPTRTFNPATGQNAAWDEKQQQWIDVKTGQAVSPSAVVQKPTPAATPQPPAQPTTPSPTPAIQPGTSTVKPLAPTKDPATGNTTMGAVKTITSRPGTTITTTSTSTLTAGGVEISRSDTTATVTQSSSGSIRTTTTTVKPVSGGEVTTEVSAVFDGTGNQTSGAKAEVTVDPQKKTKTTQLFKWDPKANTWVADGNPKVEPVVAATHPTIYLPDTASAGSVVTGTVETQVNEAAAGTVTVTAPSGEQHLILVGAEGHFLLPAALVVAGARLIIKDELGNVIANALLNVLSGASADSASPPQIGQLPDILPQGGIARITGSHLCSPAALTDPNVLLGTPQTTDVVPTLASSDQELKFRVPRTTPPGPGSLTVENGSGRMSEPHTVNPVKITITTPPRVSIGQVFDATISFDGLTPENRQKPLMATVVVSGNATFAGGQREMRIPIRDGAARIPVVARGPGGYEVRVTGISN